MTLSNLIADRDRAVSETVARVVSILRTPMRRSDFVLAPPTPTKPSRPLIHNGRKPRR